MYPAPLNYHRAESLEDALRVLDRSGGRASCWPAARA
jgi:CO/xanthine dehydrogenase FAD-binding subunit